MRGQDEPRLRSSVAGGRCGRRVTEIEVGGEVRVAVGAVACEPEKKTARLLRGEHALHAVKYGNQRNIR